MAHHFVNHVVKTDPCRALRELLGTGAREPPHRSANVTVTRPSAICKGPHLVRLGQKINPPLYVADSVGEIPPV